MTTAPGFPIPPTVPGYELGDLLGRGSVGTVWSATRTADRRAVAVKVVPVSDPERVRALARELTVLSRVRVDGLVGFHEAVGLAEGEPAVALVLDHLAGGSLERAVRARGHLSAGETVTVLAPVARALAGLHGLGVVHGDVSPGNVLLARTGQPFIADLGVARVTGEVPGSLWGTSGFVAPEVLDLGQLTTAADVYAVGALAWWCVTGRPPEPAAVRPPLEELAPGMPERWAEVTRRSLSGDPALRPTAAEQALAYYDSTPCEPLRLVVGTDETSLLTHRLRQLPTTPPPADDPPPRSRLRRPTRRRAAPLLVLAVLAAGSGYGALVAADVLSRPSWLDPTTSSAPGSSGPGASAPGASAPGASAVGPSALGPSAQGPSAPGPSAHGASAAGPAPTPDAPVAGARAAPASPRTSTATPAPEPPVRADPTTDRSAPSRDARGLVVALGRLRADAMTQHSAARIAQLDAPGSVALARDRALLADLTASATSWRGVRFEVTSARTAAHDGRTATVDAVVATAAYQVVDAGGTVVTRPADPPRRLRFELVWAGGRWKVQRVAAATG